MTYCRYLLAVLLLAIFFNGNALALSSPNIPLDSPIYLYIEKLSGFGLIVSDFKGIRPYSRSEAARLVKEASERLELGDYPSLAKELLARIKELIPRETALRDEPGKVPFFDLDPVSNARLRYVSLDGAPRNYSRLVNDPGGDYTFPLIQWRLKNPYPNLVRQRGTEGTPLSENNEGIVYGKGNNIEARWSSEAYLGTFASFLVEPLLLGSSEAGASQMRLNKGYLKLGGGALELELGRDSNWLGLGYRSAITLTDNAANFTGVKLSSPEPVTSRYLWDFKYDLIVSQFDRTVTDGAERQPLFYAVKLSLKPLKNLEFGLNLGRQVGGPGVDNSLTATLNGLIGASVHDNSHTQAGLELRYRFPWLRNSEIYGEFSGSDRSDFWPKAQSYVAGFFVPNLTASGEDDLRFEWFRGHPILYVNSTFPEGYLYHNFPIGASQGGATQDFLVRYSHWFPVRNTLALEGILTTRGDVGRVPVDSTGGFDPTGVMQAIERKLALRAFWSLPVSTYWNAIIMYGWETIKNWELEPGVNRTNQLVRVDLSYRY